MADNPARDDQGTEGPGRRLRKAGDARPAQGRSAATWASASVARCSSASASSSSRWRCCGPCRPRPATTFTGTGRSCRTSSWSSACSSSPASSWMVATQAEGEAEHREPASPRRGTVSADAPEAAPEKVTRADIEAKLRELTRRGRRARRATRRSRRRSSRSWSVSPRSSPRTGSAAGGRASVRPCSRSGGSDVLTRRAPPRRRGPASAAG